MRTTSIVFTLDDEHTSNDIKQFYREMEDESDRCLSILIAAYFDEALGSILGSNAPDGFHSRICAALQHGILTQDEHDDLQLIRQIRNAFAHEYLSKTFDQETEVLVDQLKTVQLHRDVLDNVGFNSAKNKLRYVAIAFCVRIAQDYWSPAGKERNRWDDAFPAFLTE
ncbi:MAG: hypothetical protein KDA63_13565 [Planctomycetales bacterium]|nr:hypothetical protein [Planctomycetales bacterium]